MRLAPLATARPAASGILPDSIASVSTVAIARRSEGVAAPRPALACAAAAISGFVALVYEVAFTRLLALVIGPTTYAFATMAASFISGLALGSAAGARPGAAGRRGRPLARRDAGD